MMTDSDVRRKFSSPGMVSFLRHTQLAGPFVVWILPACFALASLAIVFGQIDDLLSPFAVWSTPGSRAMAYFIVGTLVLPVYAFTRPPVKELALVLGGGLFSGWFIGVSAEQLFSSGVTGFIAPFGFPFFCMAVVALVGLTARALLTRNTIAVMSDPRVSALMACMFALLYMFFSPTFVNVTIIFHPETFDNRLYALDALFGFEASVFVGKLFVTHSAVLTFFQLAYAFMFVSFLAVLGSQIREEWRGQGWQVAEVWFVISILGVMAYHLFPVSGPVYAFKDKFPASMPDPSGVGLVSAIVAPAMRNGVPSLHLGWSLAAWLVSLPLRNRTIKWVSGLVALAMVPATLGLGEHYLLDLVIAVPFVVGTLALTVRGLGWQSPARRMAAWTGWGFFLAWLILLRFAAEWLLQAPWVVPVLSIVSSGASAWRMRALICAVRGGGEVAEVTRVDQASALGGSFSVRLAALFFLSGFAALMYEVLFSKKLAVTFGSSSLATYTVLATYMGGMAIGSWLGGILAARGGDLLKRYVVCEGSIAAYCVLTPFLFDAVHDLYAQWATNAPVDAGWVVALRFGLGALVLMVPTILMGMTLPILTACLDRGAAAYGRVVSVLYGANTLGAALGALLAGYVLIPTLGLQSTTLLAALLNLLVAAFGGEMGKRLKQVGARLEQDEDATSALSASGRALPGWLVLMSFGGVGLVCLGLETLYMHLLAVVAGNSTYAFSLMLFAFLLGLGGGATVIRQIPQAISRPEVAMVVLLMLLAMCLGIGESQWSNMADYFASFAGYPMPSSFGGRELVRAAVCLIALVPPAFLIGAFFPLAMGAVGRAGGVRALGTGAAVNTLGNIAGVFIGGFVLLPTVGALGGIKVLAVLAMGLAVCIVIGAGLMRERVLVALGGMAALCVVAAPTDLDYTRLASGANVYFQPQHWGRVIDHAESADGGLTSVHVTLQDGGTTMKTLTTNGKFQGNDSGEVEAQIGFALVPLAENPRRDDALVIGYGTGTTANTLKHAGFRQIDVVDLSRDVIRLANAHFAHLNERVTEAPGVKLHIADGRNYLLLQHRQYDLITVELTSIWFAGAAASYNREFYQLARQRLRPGGVLQQWVQLHHLSGQDLLALLASVRSEFADVKVFHFGGQGMIVARNGGGAPMAVGMGRPQDEPAIRAYSERILGRPLAKGPERLLNAQGVDNFLSHWGDAEDWASTD
ncbi:MAG TPA: fused MFS/spermidine synthase, partial [Rhodocyclaceae bacterium]|nr:fused MFS/spermidine synthase [Rhodocyclaceae bacterium]